MKNQTLKQSVKYLLIVTLTLPGLTWAQVGAVQQVEDIAAGQFLSKIENLMSDDIKRREMVNALINYEAGARLNEYNYNQKLLFMMAPGSSFALAAGVVASNSTLPNPNTGVSPFLRSALNFSNAGLSSTLTQLTSISNQKITLNGQEYDRKSDPMDYWYKLLEDFYKTGNSTKIAPFNPAQFLTSDNLVKSNLKNQGDDFIQVMTNPVTTPSMTLLMGEQTGGLAGLTGLGGKGQEALVNEMVQTALIGVSTSAWGHILALRTPQGGQSQSIMEMMNQHSQERFTHPEWHAQIATASEAALLREIAHMLAYQQFADYQHLRLSEQQVALLASINKVMAEINSAVMEVKGQIEKARVEAAAQAAELESNLPTE